MNKMRKFAFISLLSCIIFSCLKDKESDIEKYPQQWQLIKMTKGMIPDSEVTGDDMVWQEYYVLNSDETCTKSQTKDGKTTTIDGVFSWEDLSDGKYLRLTYHTSNTIIGNCSHRNEEFLALKSDTKLTGIWFACDGPGLEYERVN